MRDGPNRSPADMFGFDMLVHGDRGHELAQEASDSLSESELEIYGVDWEGLEDNLLLSSQQSNNSDSEISTSWIGRRGPPDNLNEVALEAPDLSVSMEEANAIYDAVHPWIGCVEEDDINMLWNNSLVFARAHYGDQF